MSEQNMVRNHEKIRAARQRTRVSQAEVGLAYGKSQTWFARIERGLVSMDDAATARIIRTIRQLEDRRKAMLTAAAKAITQVRADFKNPKMVSEGDR